MLAGAVVMEPEYETVQSDGTKFVDGEQIEEVGLKVLRVILLAYRETIDHAFFDRSFRRLQ